MQEKYLYDIGDFGKFLLLRVLLNQTNLKLGVNWCLVTDKEKNKDGKYIDYILEINPQIKNCFKGFSEDVYHSLWGLSKRELRKEREKEIERKRNMTDFENLNLFPNTRYFKESMSSSKRENWLRNAKNYLEDCDIIFFDPDNGLSIKEHKKGKNISIKEVSDSVKPNQSIIIYQHSVRTEKFDSFLKKRIEELKKILNRDSFDFKCLRYHRGTARAYILVLSKKNPNLMKNYDSLVKNFNEKPRKEKHFSEVAIP